jgi:hypothetical protein
MDNQPEDSEVINPTEEVENNEEMGVESEDQPSKKLGKKGVRVSRVMDENKLEILRLARIKAVEVRKKNAEARKLALEDPTSNKVPVKALKKQLKESITKQVKVEEVDVDKLLNDKIDKIKLEEERINSIVNQKLMKLQVKENKEIEVPKPKKKKKIIYEDSDSEEEEVIVRRRKPKNKIEPPEPSPIPPPPTPQQPSAQEIQQRQMMEFQQQIQQSIFNNRMRIPRMGR